MRLILGLILFFFSLSLFSQNNNSQTAYQHFIKGDYGALKTRGGQILQFVSTETGKRAAIKDFSFEIPTDRETHESSSGVWYKAESSLPSYSLNEVKFGFEMNDDTVSYKNLKLPTSDLV